MLNTHQLLPEILSGCVVLHHIEWAIIYLVIFQVSFVFLLFLHLNKNNTLTHNMLWTPTSVFFIDPEWILGGIVDAWKQMAILMTQHFYKPIISQEVFPFIIIVSLCCYDSYVTVYVCGCETPSRK